ncbi:MAG TPA: universal stress protein [Solirubrobacterales bacterium]|nr:universal stress protein [Solirubrobacterales bacterium]
MYKRILVGYLENDPGHDALALGTALAGATGAELIAVTAPDEQGHGLAALARSHEADLIVLGPTHRSGLGRVIPGSTLEHLLGEAPCAVAVAPAGFAASGDDPAMRVVGVGYDASPAAAQALESAKELALRNGAAMRVYAVAPKHPQLPGAESPSPGKSLPSEAEELREALHEAVAKLPSEARALPVFSRGWPAEELVKASASGVDLLFLGSRSGGPLRRALHNSISNGVILRALCPVLVVPTEIAAPA